MTRTSLILTAILLASSAAFAGCTTAPLATTHLAIDFAGAKPNVKADVASDLSSRPTAARYQADRIPHADGYTAHDQLEDWSRASGTPYAATSYNGSFGSGYFLTSVANVTPSGSTAYWALSINGKSSEVGMSQAILRDGDSVAWTWTPVALDSDGNSSSTSALDLKVDAPAPTQNDSVLLHGTVHGSATVSVRGGPAAQAKDGAWALAVPLAYGHNNLTLVADDGKHSSVSQVVAVRLASVSFAVKYTMAVPPHDASSDTVWYDPDAMASLPLYAGTTAKHPPTANVHDVMVTWTQQTGTPIAYGGPGSFGFSVESIDGVGQPLSSEAPPYWGYKVNGSTAGLGITDQAVQPGDAIVWEYLDGS